MIQGIIQMYTEGGDYQQEYPLSENYFNLEKYHADGGLGMERILMGLVTQPAQTNDLTSVSGETNCFFTWICCLQIKFSLYDVSKIDSV